MKVESRPKTPSEVRALAVAWYEQQIAISKRALGSSWAEHAEFVESYVAEEVRQRLMSEYGWRPKA